MLCTKCGKETNNPKFCSRTCSIIYANHTQPKRKKTGKCKICQSSIYKHYTHCQNCILSNKEKSQNITLSEISYDKYIKAANYSKIRLRARYIIKKLGIKSCQNCGYDKHTEVCHVKHIHEFNSNTSVYIINDPKNLLVLCPNCHWEFDHGILTIDEIKK